MRNRHIKDNLKKSFVFDKRKIYGEVIYHRLNKLLLVSCKQLKIINIDNSLRGLLMTVFIGSSVSIVSSVNFLVNINVSITLSYLHFFVWLIF